MLLSCFVLFVRMESARARVKVPTRSSLVRSIVNAGEGTIDGLSFLGCQGF